MGHVSVILGLANKILGDHCQEYSATLSRKYCFWKAHHGENISALYGI